LIAANAFKVHEHPAVDDLEPQRDLVGALQVALAVRVTELDQLDRNLTLHAPTNRRPVAHEAAELGVRRLRDAGDGRRDRRGEALEVGDVRAVAELRELLPAVRVAGGGEGPGVLRVERDTVRDVPGGDDRASRRLDLEVSGAGDLDALRGVVQLAGDRRRAVPVSGLMRWMTPKSSARASALPPASARVERTPSW
jgi:hypothetical protein